MKNKWTALALLTTTQFVLILDSTIVGIALPLLGQDLRMGQEQLSWVHTAYSLVFGGLLLLGGRLSDFFGRRRVFVAGMLLFALASLLGGLASGGVLVVAMRAVQGMAAALVAPAALSLVMTIFNGDPDRDRAMGLWGAVGGVGASTGVVLGGVLTDWLGWRSVFYVNVPVGVVVAVLALSLLPQVAPSGARGFDVLGAVTSTAGLGLLMYAVVESSLPLGGLAVVVLALFLVIESRSKNPLMPLSIFRKPLLRAGNAIMFLVAAAAQPLFVILTLYTQYVLGYSATEAGLSVVAISIAIALTASTVGGRFVSRFGIRATAVTGMALITAGAVAYLRITPTSTFLGALLAPELLTGIGFGLLVVAVTIAATAEATPEEAGLASGLFNVTPQVGISIGVAALVSLATTVSGPNPSPEALTSGYQAAIMASAGIGVVGLLAAIVMLPRRAAKGTAARPTAGTRA
ncbi:MFS transporter [Nonomuraea sp. NPDC059023]|uniref:MFS transporter n=1 Tax=unclassified Nonomuraea TaxID=2593643 RepID=UPI0036BD5D6F